MERKQKLRLALDVIAVLYCLVWTRREALFVYDLRFRPALPLLVAGVVLAGLAGLLWFLCRPQVRDAFHRD